MKGAGTHVTGAVSAMFPALLVYLFSYPLVVGMIMKCGSWSHLGWVTKFYSPVVLLALRCPPYREILDWEYGLLGGGAPGTVYLFAAPW